MNKKSKSKARTKLAFPNRDEIVTHQTSVDFLGMIDYLPNPDVILKDQGETQRAYDNILTDSHLSGTISQRKSAVTSMNWEIDRGKSKSREAKTIIKAFENLDVYRIIEDALDAPYFGLIPMEVIWEKPNSAGQILPYDVIGKPPEWFQYDSNNILRFVSRTHQTTGEEIPPRRIIEVRHFPTYKNPYGNALLSKCFWPVNFKKGGLKFWVTFAEKFGIPTVLGKVPRGSDDAEFQKLATLLSETIQDGVIIMPDDSIVEMMSADKSGTSGLFKDLATFCNQEISKAILSQTLTTEATETGTQALGTVHAVMRQDIVNQDKRMVENCFNTLIDWIMEINFGSSENSPEFTLYHDEDVDLNQATRDQTLTATNAIKFTKDYYKKTYGFDDSDFDIVETPAPAPAQNDDESNFSENIFKDQRAIDALIESFGPKDLQAQSAFVKPILKLASKAENFDEFREGLKLIFPKVRPENIEAELRNVIFVSRVWGRLNGKEN